MSTNYYLQKDPYGRRHIGKTFYGGYERGIGFIWALERDTFCALLVRPDAAEIEVRNEYGERSTLPEFAQNVIERVCFHDESYVGTEFS